MKNFTRAKQVILLVVMGLLVAYCPTRAQSPAIEQAFDLYEIKSLLLKHKETAERILSLKKFKLASSKERSESTIYTYKSSSDTTQLYMRVRRADGLVSEVAWTETSASIGNLTHDAVYDGFVPVSGNSMYQNRFQHMSLLVGYQYASSDTIPCSMRSTKQ